MSEKEVFSGTNVKAYMLEEINHMICHYAAYTGGINVEVSLNPKQKNSEFVRDVLEVVKGSIEAGDLDENRVQEFYAKHKEKLEGENAGGKDIEEDKTLDEKYYIINYDEEPFIPQQHYFNAFYSVDQIMYDREEAEEALAEHQHQQQQALEMEGQGQYDEHGHYNQEELMHGHYE